MPGMTRSQFETIRTALTTGNTDTIINALILLGHHARTGTPRADLTETAKILDADYICSLDTGELVAWYDRAEKDLIVISEPIHEATATNR